MDSVRGRDYARRVVRVDADVVRRALAFEVSAGAHGPIDVSSARPAAVIVPVGGTPGDAIVHFVVRASTLRDHAGEVGFPGGKVEASDASFVDAALREMEEEVAVLRDRAHVIGELRSVPVISGRYVIHPFVALLDEGITPRAASRAASSEVQAVIATPIAPFVTGELPIHVVTLALDDGTKWVAPHFEIEGRVLYGASAYVFYELVAKVARALGRELPPHRPASKFPWGDRYS